MEKTNNDKYANDTYDYGKDINADLVRFEKLIFKWTYHAIKMVNPSFYEAGNGIQLSIGPLGLTFDDIKQEMSIVVWNVFMKYNKLGLNRQSEIHPVAYYIGMLENELKFKAVEIYRNSNTKRSGKGLKHVNGPQADNMFYGLVSDWEM